MVVIDTWVLFISNILIQHNNHLQSTMFDDRSSRNIKPNYQRLVVNSLLQSDFIVLFICIVILNILPIEKGSIGKCMWVYILYLYLISYEYCKELWRLLSGRELNFGFSKQTKKILWLSTWFIQLLILTWNPLSWIDIVYFLLLPLIALSDPNNPHVTEY